MIRAKNLIVTIIISCFVINNATATDIITNTYQVQTFQNPHTLLDTSFLHFTAYFAYKIDTTLTIEKEFDNTSYRLNKHILLLVDYINTTDTTVEQKFYSNTYTYCSVGEARTQSNNKVHMQTSKSIYSNNQFFYLKLLPHDTLHAYLLYKPISFKDYAEQKNILYNYSTINDFPAYTSNTYKRNFGFTIQFLFLLGMVLIMFIFYLLAYIYLKDKIYLFYTFYLLTTFIQVLYMSQYIFSKNLKMFNFTGNSAVDESTKGLMILFYSVFYKQAFNITKKDTVLYFSVEALKYISLLYVIVIIFCHLCCFSFYSEPFVYSFYRFPIFFFSIVILIYTYNIKNRTLFQNIIFSGSLVYTLFTAISTLQKINFPIKDFYVGINVLYLGVTLELIIFSVALIIRIKDSFVANEKLKDKLIVELQQNEEYIKNENILLEEKVKQRVTEINQQNIFIEEQKRNALVQEFEKEKIEIQLLALSSQMNPHFIFNCMNSIQHSIITNDTEKASTMLHNFASLIRMVLENSSQPDITLENEIKLLDTYLKLEQERINNTFEYEIIADKDISSDFIKIPIMMLQPFLENAVWHGFKFINYKGKINVHFSMVGQLIRCEITDNGIGRDKAAEYKLRYKITENKSIAIKIIENRIDLLNQTLNEQKASLTIEDNLNNEQQIIGTKVIILLPTS